MLRRSEQWHRPTVSSALTGAVRGAKNCDTCPLVVSLLPQCGAHHASEQQACLAGQAAGRRGFCLHHPTTPGGENSGFHLLFLTSARDTDFPTLNSLGAKLAVG
jgi:hypothetical protein